MLKLAKRHQTFKTIEPDLFNWRPFVAPDRVARRIADRFGVTLAHAITIARHAGLGSEARR